MEKRAICRLCAEKGESYSDILNDSQPNTEEMVQKFLGVYISRQDEFHCMCPECDKKLKEWNDYYRKVQNAQTQFNVPLKVDNEAKEDIFISEFDVKLEPLDPEVSIKEENSPLNEFEAFDVNEAGSETSSESDDDDEIEDLPKPEQVKKQEAVNDYVNRSSSPIKFPVKWADRDEMINKFYKFSCRICSLRMKTWQKYNKHLVEAHDEKPVINNCCNVRLRLERKPLLGHLAYHINPDKLRCRGCDQQFMTMESRRKHEWMHRIARDSANRKTPCPECGLELSKKSLKKHMETHLPEEEKEKLVVQCDLCKKFLKNKHTILVHMKETHLPREDLAIACDQCAKVFPSRRLFTTHYRVHHTGAVRIKCPDCGTDIKKIDLPKHQKNMHDYENQTCQICGKVFQNQRRLYTHQRRVHTEAKFDCDVCGKLFKVKDRLKLHREGHFTSNRFSCDLCDFVNNDYSNMTKHRKLKHPSAVPLAPGTARQIFEARAK